MVETLLLGDIAVMLTATSLPARSAEWEPPPPMPDKFDWVQLKSGKWLKGEIKVMYEGSLEFELQGSPQFPRLDSEVFAREVRQLLDGLPSASSKPRCRQVPKAK
jgi:hypothetical protein